MRPFPNGMASSHELIGARKWRFNFASGKEGAAGDGCSALGWLSAARVAEGSKEWEAARKMVRQPRLRQRRTKRL
jgi:hypothetical protein